METTKVTHPDIEKTEKTGYARLEPKPISGTVEFCVVLMIEPPWGVDARLTAHAADVLGDFAVDPVVCDYECRAAVAVHIDTDEGCYNELDLRQVAPGYVTAKFNDLKKSGRFASVREMAILEEAVVTIDGNRKLEDT